MPSILSYSLDFLKYRKLGMRDQIFNIWLISNFLKCITLDSKLIRALQYVNNNLLILYADQLPENLGALQIVKSI